MNIILRFSRIKCTSNCSVLGLLQRYGGAATGCDYFAWYDPPMSEQAKHVILGLLKKVRKIEAEKDRERRKAKVLLITLVSICLIIGIIVICG